jgi:hypothetical protein
MTRCNPFGAALLLLLLLAVAEAQKHTKARTKQLPPDNYYEPDVDTASPIRLPRVPASPYGMAADVCPQQNGIPYAVGGYPGTPFLQTPFSVPYRQPVAAQPTTTVCRTGDVDPKHCMSAYDLTIQAVQARPFDSTIPACQQLPPTELYGYNGQVPGPTVTAGV